MEIKQILNQINLNSKLNFWNLYILSLQIPSVQNISKCLNSKKVAVISIGLKK